VISFPIGCGGPQRTQDSAYSIPFRDYLLRRMTVFLNVQETVALSLPKILSGANALEISDIETNEHRSASACV